MGVELFVLDDGWFAGRADERAGLGDWTVDREKFPRGLGPLVERVTKLGMGFGLWVEPEMVIPTATCTTPIQSGPTTSRTIPHREPQPTGPEPRSRRRGGMGLRNR